jgi:hypothetical protein
VVRLVGKPPVCPECWSPMQIALCWRDWECAKPHGAKGLVTVSESSIEDRGGVERLLDDDFVRWGGPSRQYWRLESS